MALQGREPNGSSSTQEKRTRWRGQARHAGHTAPGTQPRQPFRSLCLKQNDSGMLRPNTPSQDKTGIRVRHYLSAITLHYRISGHFLVTFCPSVSLPMKSYPHTELTPNLNQIRFHSEEMDLRKPTGRTELLRKCAKMCHGRGVILWNITGHVSEK